MTRLTAILAATALACGAPAAAASLVIDGGGKLAGATSVDVGGVLYDVEFIDGSCISVFGDCDSQSDFAFNSQAAATLAGQALFDQVFIGIYDDQPELTLGCTDVEFCSALIPYELTATVAFVPASNSSQVLNFDNLGTGSAILTISTANFSDSVWARFTPTAVPEPASWAMMLFGFGALGFTLRSRKTTSRGLLTG